MSQTFKKKELRTLGDLAQHQFLQCNDLKRRFYGLIIDSCNWQLIIVIRCGNQTYYKADKWCEEVIAHNTEYTDQLAFKCHWRKKLSRIKSPKCMKIQYMYTLSKHLNFAQQKKSLNLLQMFLDWFTHKPTTFKKAKLLFKLTSSRYSKIQIP